MSEAVAAIEGGTFSAVCAGTCASFFFQAEDGIRDTSVTGVQTCALPISDELRGDDRRLFVVRVAPPASVAADAGVGPFVAAALAVLRVAKRVTTGGGVSIGERLGATHSVVLPPGDPALLGQVNRALSARGVRWHFGPPGPPGTLASADLAMVRGVQVNRRYRLEGTEGDSGGGARVNGEPWPGRHGGVVLL